MRPGSNLVVSSVAVLLAACGGGDGDKAPAGSAGASQPGGFSVNSDDLGTGQ